MQMRSPPTMIMYYINSEQQISFCLTLLLHLPFSLLCDSTINFIEVHGAVKRTMINSLA